MSENLVLVGEDPRFTQLMRDVLYDRIDAVFSSIDQHPSLVNLRRRGEVTLLMVASMRENYDMVAGLLKRGAIIHFTGEYWNPLVNISTRGRIDIMHLLLDYGADPCWSNDQETALILAAERGYYEMCLLLLLKGANLMEHCKYGTALTRYGFFSNQLSLQEIQEQKASLEAAWRAGPHPSQRWARRLPVMLFVAGCRFRPLSGKQGWIPPPEGLSFEQWIMARRHTLVFSSDVLLRLIVSFL